MKVILLQDVANVGKRFEETTVPDGYALNKLIPSGLAELANVENRKKIAAHKAKQMADQAAGDAAFTQAVQTLTATPVTLSAEANDQGHLFEAVKPEAIVAAAAHQGATITADQIVIAQPIKSVGEHAVTLKADGAEATITISVNAA